MRAYIFVAFTYILLLGATAYVAYVVHPLPVKPPAAGTLEAQVQQAINQADTAMLSQLAAEEAELALPDGTTVEGKQQFARNLGSFLGQQAPARFEWWEFKVDKALGNLHSPNGAYRMEILLQDGKVKKVKCSRA
ncbi:MAG: hypothetical protein J5I94_01435 [Phaeodactylibacter sp.]|nr:hypothetical protein [Phaeodactylibacter sp.]